jgi:D-lyxose ketol-isomerase
MKRSEINAVYCEALACFQRHHWALPPLPSWDITDFGLGDFAHCGLTLINLATEPEYCEKIMFARSGQITPCHMHRRKKEDIIARAGRLALRLWPEKPGKPVNLNRALRVVLNGRPEPYRAGQPMILPAGSRVTIPPGLWHEFAAEGGEAIIGEVSTANDDQNDNFFLDPAVGRFPGIEEDEPALVRLIGEASH